MQKLCCVCTIQQPLPVWIIVTSLPTHISINSHPFPVGITFAAFKRAENYLPLQPFFNNTRFGQTLINCIHNQHRRGIPDEYFVETCINTYTQNGFVTKEFMKIDEDSQAWDYTIVYIRFQGQTPPSPLATEISLKAYFPHLSLKFETI